MIKLMKYLKPYIVFAILAPLLMLLEVSMDLFQPMFMQKIVDVGIRNMDMKYVLDTLVLMIGVALIGFIGGSGCSIFSTKASINAGTDIRNDLFKKVESLSFGNIDKFETGNLITRLTNDIVQVQQVMMMYMRIMVRSPLQIIGSFVMCFIISPRLSIILLAIVPILILCLVIVIKKGYPLYMIVQSKLDKLNTVMQENLAGIRVVKAFVRKDYEIKRFGEANNNLMDATVKVSRIMTVISPIMMLLLNFGMIGVVWFGAIEVSNSNIQVGQVMAYINYLTQLLMSLMQVASLLMMISRAEASANRIMEVLNTNPEIVNAKDAKEIGELKGDLVFDNVSFSYNKGKDLVLENISFTAEQGQKIAILGSTGSGKTTLVSLIPRLYDVDKGKIMIGGINIKDITTNSLRKNIGMVLQQTILFSGTILDNITYGKSDASQEDVTEVAKIVQANEFINKFENGYQTKLEQRGMNLSGGQKQRIAIARALIKKPAILILDDSTSAVDVTTEALIQHELKNNLKNTTVLMVAQRISSVLDSDKILVLDEGQIVAQGSHKELIESSSVYRDIYRSQLGEECEDCG
jgi:ATP-binding cassette subfamily B protein